MAADEAPRKAFTIAEANAAVPVFARRVGRLRELRDEIRRNRELLDVLWGRLDGGEPALDAIGGRQAVLDELGTEFSLLVGEIEASGVVRRDLDPAGGHHGSLGAAGAGARVPGDGGPVPLIGQQQGRY